MTMQEWATLGLVAGAGVYLLRLAQARLLAERRKGRVCATCPLRSPHSN